MTLVDKIKSRGYWRINFQPLVHRMKLGLQECRDIVEKNAVELRGWDYPHFPRRTGNDAGLEPMNNYYNGWIDWTNHIEFWHMYQSGQFLHYLALREDWLEQEVIDQNMWSSGQKITPGSVLGVTGTVYQVTEIFEFLSRLAKSGVYEEGVSLSISLNNTRDRKLWIDHRMRIPFSYDRKASESSIGFSDGYKPEEVIAKSKEIAFEVIKHFFDRFGWYNPPIETIKKDQSDLLSSKF